MEEIIKQIAQIDFVAVSNRRNSEEALKEKRTNYEKEMTTYREETINEAHKKAEAIYNQIVLNGEKDRDIETRECKKMAVAAKNKYLALEEQLLDEVFNELFIVEG